MPSYKRHALLCEALRRYTRFGEGKDLTVAWTGLGNATEYKPVSTAGLMEPIYKITKGTMGWWRLTNKGAAIVKSWLDQGFDHKKIEAGSIPPMQS